MGLTLITLEDLEETTPPATTGAAACCVREVPAPEKLPYCVTCGTERERVYYPTADAAAVAVLQEFGPQAMAEGNEYGGLIYFDEHGYYPGDVVRGDTDSVPQPIPISRHNVAGAWHTHPPNPLEFFSPHDIDYARTRGWPHWLGTHSGKIMKFDPSLPGHGTSTLPQTF